MNRYDRSYLPAPSARLVREELARVLGSPAFSGALNAQRLLHYLAEHAMAGESDRLKESVLAAEVFQRGVVRFDPVKDSIVRVEARRLRQRLVRHYATELPSDRVHLELPAGRYALHVVAPLGASLPPAGGAAEWVDSGDFFLRLGHEEGWRRALALYERAALEAPSHVEAQLGVAQAATLLVVSGCEAAKPGAARATAACERVLALAGPHGQALALLAVLKHRVAHDAQAARALYARALEAAPTSADVHSAHAESLTMTGCFDAAAEALRLARAIDPTDVAAREREAFLQYYRRDLAGAERLAHELLAQAPRSAGAHDVLGRVHLARGEADAALTAFRALQTAHPQLAAGPVGVAQALALAGRQQEARVLLERLQQPRLRPLATAYQAAAAYLRLGDGFMALTLLESAAENGDPNLYALLVDPAIDSLRGERRVDSLIQRTGLVAAASQDTGALA